MVPSSTSVTSGDATCSPRRPLNTEAPLSTRSFSRPWPQASWNSTPPPPGPMTTGSVPDGAGRAASLVMARLGGGAGELLDLVAVEQLEADRCGRSTRSRSACRCRRRPRPTRRTACGPGRRRRAGRRCWPRGSGGASRRSGRAPGGSTRPRPGRPRRPGAAGRPWRPWPPSRAGSRPRSGRGGVLAGERHLARRRRRPSGRRRPRPRPRRARPVVGQVGGVGEAGGLADHDPDAGAAVAARGQLLDPAVVEHGRRRPLVLDEHLGEVAAGAEGGGQRALDDGVVEHGRPPEVGGDGTVGRVLDRPAGRRPGPEQAGSLFARRRRGCVLYPGAPATRPGRAA